MVRRYRYQRGHLFKRGTRNQAWVARWRETVIEPKGTARSINRSEVLALVRDVRTRREALGILEKRLGDLNQGLRRMHPTISFGEFANTWEEAVLPTYRTSTRNFYQGVLNRNFHFELLLHPKTYACYPVVSTANSSGLFEVVVGHILAVLRSRCAGFACPACLAADTYPARPLLST